MYASVYFDVGNITSFQKKKYILMLEFFSALYLAAITGELLPIPIQSKATRVFRVFILALSSVCHWHVKSLTPVLYVSVMRT